MGDLTTCLISFPFLAGDGRDTLVLLSVEGEGRDLALLTLFWGTCTY